jgi:hypothetical protein
MVNVDRVDKFYPYSATKYYAAIGENDYQFMDSIVCGLWESIDDWEKYHIEAAREYASFRERIRKA